MTCLDTYQPVNRVRTDGRIRAAGNSMRELHAEVRERSHRNSPKEMAKPLVLAELAKWTKWSGRSMELAINAALEKHRIRVGHLAAATGMESSAVSRALCLELDTLNIGYLASRLGYEAKGSYGVVFVLRSGPPPAEVLDLLRKAARSGGSLTDYALRCEGVAMCTSYLKSMLRGEIPIRGRYLTPLGIIHRRDGMFVREVKP